LIPADFATDPLLIVAAVIVAVFGIGRTVRLLTYDDFPPSIWVRSLWNRVTRGSLWHKIVTCLWCASPYITAICMGWFFLGLFLWQPLLIAWWIVWGFAALSYAASILVRRDEPEGE
jgi:hypothetical protein